MSNNLWAPWRMDYILGPKKDGCVFCDAWKSNATDAEDNLIIGTDDSCFVIMNRYPYSHGHIMVVPARHVSNLDDLTSQERICLFNLLVKAQSVLTKTLAPQGLNIGMNIGKAAGAGIADHLHIHIVPRWDGDTNFMPLIADVRVMPQHLHATCASLAAEFKERR